MRDTSVVSVHPHPGFVDDDFADLIQSVDEDYDFYCVTHNARQGVSDNLSPNPSMFYDGVFEDDQGRGVLPYEMVEELSEYDSSIFVGGYATECVRRAMSSLQRHTDVYLGENLTYEKTSQGTLTVEEIRSDQEIDDVDQLRSLYLDVEIEDYLVL